MPGIHAGARLGEGAGATLSNRTRAVALGAQSSRLELDVELPGTLSTGLQPALTHGEGLMPGVSEHVA